MGNKDEEWFKFVGGLFGHRDPQWEDYYRKQRVYTYDDGSQVQVRFDWERAEQQVQAMKDWGRDKPSP